MNNTLSKSTIGFGISAAITIILNMFLMILKEKIPEFHDAMVAFTGHHWVSHGVIDVVIFILLGIFFAKKALNKNISALLISSTIISIVGVMIFFIF